MAKAAFGEYAAFTTRNTVRYQKNSRLVSEAMVPPEVVSYLNKQLNYTPKELPAHTFAPPTEAEKEKLRAESLETPPELQRDVLTPDDFDVPEVTDDEIEAVASEIPKETLEPSPSESPSTPVSSDFLEQVSIHTASLQDIAEALFSRFGIYTVYLGKLPEADEMNPLTGEMFSKYHLGIAYQAAIRAHNQGILSRPAEMGRKVIDQGKQAHQEFAVDPRPMTMADARRMDSFDYRTSSGATRPTARTEIIHELGEDGKMRAIQREIPAGEIGSANGATARYDAEEDQPLVQPNFGKPVIRPDW